MARRVDTNQQMFAFDGEDFAPSAQPHPGKWLPMASSRVMRARYDSGLQQIQVVFRDGTPWVYDGVPQNIWRNFRRSASPGRYINRVLNGFPYYQGSFDSAESSGEDE